MGQRKCYSMAVSTPLPEKCACIGYFLQIKKPVLEDAVVGAFMAGADFVPPRKKKHEPLIKFLGKRAVLREQVPPMHGYIFSAFLLSYLVGFVSQCWGLWSYFSALKLCKHILCVLAVSFGPQAFQDVGSTKSGNRFVLSTSRLGHLLNWHRFHLKYE